MNSLAACQASDDPARRSRRIHPIENKFVRSRNVATHRADIITVAYSYTVEQPVSKRCFSSIVSPNCYQLIDCWLLQQQQQQRCEHACDKPTYMPRCISPNRYMIGDSDSQLCLWLAHNCTEVRTEFFSLHHRALDIRWRFVKRIFKIYYIDKIYMLLVSSFVTMSNLITREVPVGSRKNVSGIELTSVCREYRRAISLGLLYD